MKLLLSFLLLFTLSPMLMAQGIAVRSNGGVETNGTFYGLSSFRGSSGTLRLYGESSSANKKDFRLSSGSDLLRFMWVNDAGNSLLVLGSVDSLGNWSFDGSVTAPRFIGSGSNLTDLAVSGVTNGQEGVYFNEPFSLHYPGGSPVDWVFHILPGGGNSLALAQTNSSLRVTFNDSGGIHADGLISSSGFSSAGNITAVSNVVVGGMVNYSTNAHASATNSLDMSKAYWDFTATTAVSITNFSHVDPTRENSSVLMVTNGSGGNLVLYLTSGVTTMDGARSCVLTNNTLTIFSFSIYGNRFTNCAYRTFY